LQFLSDATPDNSAVAGHESFTPGQWYEKKALSGGVSEERFVLCSAMGGKLPNNANRTTLFVLCWN